MIHGMSTCDSGEGFIPTDNRDELRKKSVKEKLPPSGTGNNYINDTEQTEEAQGG